MSYEGCKTCGNNSSFSLNLSEYEANGLVSGPYLESFDLDELFDPIDDEDVSALVVIGDVSGMKPAVLDRFSCCLFVVQVAQHYLKKLIE